LNKKNDSKNVNGSLAIQKIHFDQNMDKAKYFYPKTKQSLNMIDE